MKKISVLLVVHNEEKQISDCLERLCFSDEIVVILDKCTDNTLNIVKKFTNQFYSGSWDIEGDRRNYGIQKCKNDWILEIDADERINVKLSKEILYTIKNSQYDWHQINVDNYINRKLISYGWGAYFGKSSYAGLFRKNFKTWGSQRVHPKITLFGNRGGNLKNHLIHYYCHSIADLIKKLDGYSSARALDLEKENINENIFTNIRRVFSRFWKCFILRKGFKEGRIGIMIGIVAGLYPLLSYLKYKENKND
jgi:glycosyltransferase involved in cell wall biosynthesis